MSKKEIKILEVGTPEITSEMKLTYKKYDENETYIQSLKHIRNDLNKMIDNEYDRENIKLQSIINKAIEFITKNTEYLDIEKGEVFECEGYKSNRVPIISVSGLLNILKGDDNV